MQALLPEYAKLAPCWRYWEGLVSKQLLSVSILPYSCVDIVAKTPVRRGYQVQERSQGSLWLQIHNRPLDRWVSYRFGYRGVARPTSSSQTPSSNRVLVQERTCGLIS